MTHTNGDPYYSSMPFGPPLPREGSWASGDAGELAMCWTAKVSPPALRGAIKALVGEKGQEGVSAV